MKKTLYYRHIEVKNLISEIDKLYEQGRIVESVEWDSDVGSFKVTFFQYNDFLNDILKKFELK
jgi:hypothetical protein